MVSREWSNEQPPGGEPAVPFATTTVYSLDGQCTSGPHEPHAAEPHRNPHRSRIEQAPIDPACLGASIEWQNYPKFRCLQLIMILIQRLRSGDKLPLISKDWNGLSEMDAFEIRRTLPGVRRRIRLEN